jgi:hypothetical protein
MSKMTLKTEGDKHVVGPDDSRHPPRRSTAPTPSRV